MVDLGQSRALQTSADHLEGVGMKSATRIAASTLGAYAGLLSVEHGVFETLQGDAAPSGLMISAIGASCQADAVWHACFPAMTLVPSFLVTGVLAIIFSLIALVWAAAFVERKHGGLFLILLSITMLLVGGGFIPTFIGIIAGVARTRINAPLTWGRARLSGNLIRSLAKLWPWTLIAMVVWFPGGWILGHFFNQTMVNLSFILFFAFDLGLPLLTVFTGIAYDAQQAHSLSR